MPHCIEYRVKVRTFREADGSTPAYFAPKRNITRADCTMRPTDHAFYNADVFPSMLNRLHSRIMGEREFVSLESLPAGVTVDTTGFLATVRIDLPESFR